MNKKDQKTSVRKHAKIHEITVIKQGLSSHFNPFDYIIWGFLKNKTNATSHHNIGSLKTALKEDLNKMSKEFTLKACKKKGKK